MKMCFVQNSGNLYLILCAYMDYFVTFAQNFL